MQGSGLPSLLQSRLNAPRILKISKVASYVVTKLAEEGVPLEPRRLYYDPSWQAQLEASFCKLLGFCLLKLKRCSVSCNAYSSCHQCTRMLWDENVPTATPQLCLILRCKP